MFKQILKQASIATLASSPVSAKIPTFGTHHALFLRCRTSSGTLTRANVISDITNVIVRANGEQLISAKASDLLTINKYYNDYKAAIGIAASDRTNADAFDLTATTGDFIIPIWFDRSDLATDAQRQLFSLGMKGVSSFTVDITCGALVNTANHVGMIDIHSLVSPQVKEIGQHVRIQSYPFTLGTGTTDIEFATLPKEQNTGYLALHLHHATVAITKATVKLGGYNIIQEVPQSIQNAMGFMSGRQKQPLYSHIDFGLSRDVLGGGFLPMMGVQDFRLVVDFASDPSAGPLTVIAERIYNLNVNLAA